MYTTELAVFVMAMATMPLPSTADYEKVCTQDAPYQGGQLFLCGPALARILSALCKHGYHPPTKRSGDSRDASVGVESEENIPRDVFLPKTRAMAYLQHKRSSLGWDGQIYRSQGIVCECCYNRCDIGELQQYCALGRRGEGRGFSIFNKRFAKGKLGQKSDKKFKTRLTVPTGGKGDKEDSGNRINSEHELGKDFQRNKELLSFDRHVSKGEDLETDNALRKDEEELKKLSRLGTR